MARFIGSGARNEISRLFGRTGSVNRGNHLNRLKALPFTLLAALSLVGAAAANGNEDEIRAEIQAYLEAWNAGDAEDLASFYTEDGDRANNRGDVFRGRPAILAHYQKVFAASPAPGVERRLVYHQVDVRMVSSDAAVVDVQYEVSGINPEVDWTTHGRNTVFMVYRDGRWLRAAHRNSIPLPAACLETCVKQDLLPGQ